MRSRKPTLQREICVAARLAKAGLCKWENSFLSFAEIETILCPFKSTCNNLNLIWHYRCIFYIKSGSRALTRFAESLSLSFGLKLLCVLSDSLRFSCAQIEFEQAQFFFKVVEGFLSIGPSW